MTGSERETLSPSVPVSIGVSPGLGDRQSLPAATERLPAWQWFLPALAAVVVCLPAFNGDFIWDDRGLYIVDNQLLRAADGPWRFWFTTDCVDYYPLSYTTYWLEYHLAGLDPRLYHASNFLLHGIATALLVRLLAALRVPGAWLVGLVFAVHPLQVETVAWISQRKSLLAAVFGFAAGRDFLRWEADRRLAPLVRSVVWFALSLAGKPTFIMLPVVLAGRLVYRDPSHWRRAMVPLVPFVAVSVLFGLVGIPFQQKGFDADVRGQDLVTRVASLGWTAWFYVLQSLRFWQTCFIYPRWQIDGQSAVAWLPNLGILAAAAALWAARARLGILPLAAWLAYLVTMLPALGVVDVGFWQYSFVADHYVYQSLPALLAFAAALVAPVARRRPRSAAATICLLAAVMAAVSWREAGFYRTEEKLWRETLRRNPAAAIAWYSVAPLEAVAQRYDRAEDCYRRALAHAPRMERAWCALGEACRSQLKWAEAAKAYQGLFALDKPPSLERLTAAVGLAGALVKLGAAAEALDMLENLVPAEWPLVSMRAAERATLEGRAAVYRAAAARAAVGADIGPLMAALADHCDKHPGAREAVARACDEMGNHAAAAAVWARVAADDPALLPNLAASRMAAGDVAGGVAAFEAAVAAAPHDAAMVANLAQALAMAGRFDESRANYARAIRMAESSDVSADLIRGWREQQATVGGSEGRVR